MITQIKFWATTAFDSSVWELPGMNISLFRPDWMHVADLGALVNLVCAVSFECFQVLGGYYTNSVLACNMLLNALTMSARNLNVEMSFADLTIGMIRSKAKYRPCLRVKAAAARYTLPIVEHRLTHLNSVYTFFRFVFASSSEK